MPRRKNNKDIGNLHIYLIWRSCPSSCVGTSSSRTCHSRLHQDRVCCNQTRFLLGQRGKCHSLMCFFGTKNEGEKKHLTRLSCQSWTQGDLASRPPYVLHPPLALDSSWSSAGGGRISFLDHSLSIHSNDNHLIIEACQIIVVVKHARCWTVPHDWGSDSLGRFGDNYHLYFVKISSFWMNMPPSVIFCLLLSKIYLAVSRYIPYFKNWWSMKINSAHIWLRM